MTFSNAVRSIFSSVVESLIQMFVKMGIQWAEGLIYQQVAQKATAISSITANSGIAATAAMASVAAIPFYGWAMAPEVGASTFEEGLAYLASASAAGGYDIPPGVNPVTQLHAREMVLPQSIADPIRDMASGGAKGSTVHIHGKPNSVYTQDQLVAALKSAGHRFKLKTSPSFSRRIRGWSSPSSAKRHTKHCQTRLSPIKSRISPSSSIQCIPTTYSTNCYAMMSPRPNTAPSRGSSMPAAGASIHSCTSTQSSIRSLLSRSVWVTERRPHSKSSRHFRIPVALVVLTSSRILTALLHSLITAELLAVQCSGQRAF